MALQQAISCEMSRLIDRLGPVEADRIITLVRDTTFKPSAQAVRARVNAKLGGHEIDIKCAPSGPPESRSPSP